MKKRNLFAELTEGLDAFAAEREASHASQAVTPPETAFLADPVERFRYRGCTSGRLEELS